MKRIIKICIIVFLIFVIGVIGLFVYSFSVSSTDSKTNLTTVDWLPKTATNISYFRQTGFASILIYECSIPKEHLLSLANKEKWVMENKSNIKLSYMTLFNDTIDVDYSKAIEKGLVYEKRFSNGGGTTVVYDELVNKLYYSYNHN